MTDMDELVDQEVEKLKERGDVRAVAIFGSYARDPDQEHNDIDLFAIVDGNWRKRVGEEIEGVIFEKFFNSMKWAKHYLERAEDKDEWAYPYRWFANPDIRYDPEDLFEELKQKAEDFKEKKFEDEIDEERFLYNIWDRQQDIQVEDDVGQKRFMMYKFFDYLLTRVYMFNGEVPVKENYRIRHLKDFDGYLYKLAQEFLTSSSTLEKEKKLEKMVDHVTKNEGEPGSKWETDKEEFEDSE